MQFSTPWCFHFDFFLYVPYFYPNIYFYNFSSSWTYLNVHAKFHTPMTIPSHMIINEDGTGQTDRQMFFLQIVANKCIRYLEKIKIIQNIIFKEIFKKSLYFAQNMFFLRISLKYGNYQKNLLINCKYIIWYIVIQISSLKSFEK